MDNPKKEETSITPNPEAESTAPENAHLRFLLRIAVLAITTLVISGAFLLIEAFISVKWMSLDWGASPQIALLADIGVAGIIIWIAWRIGVSRKLWGETKITLFPEREGRKVTEQKHKTADGGKGLGVIGVLIGLAFVWLLVEIILDHEQDRPRREELMRSQFALIRAQELDLQARNDAMLSWHGLVGAREFPIALSSTWSKSIPIEPGQSYEMEPHNLPLLRFYDGIKIVRVKPGTKAPIPSQARSVQFRLDEGYGITATNMIVAVGKKPRGR